MHKVIVQVDWCTKIILILIAVLLAGILAKPHVVDRPVNAHNSVPLPDAWVAVGSPPVPSRTGPLSLSGFPIVVIDLERDEGFCGADDGGLSGGWVLRRRY